MAPRFMNLSGREIAQLLFIDRVNRGNNIRVPAQPPNDPYNLVAHKRLLRRGLIELNTEADRTDVTEAGHKALAFWRFELGIKEN